MFGSLPIPKIIPSLFSPYCKTEWNPTPLCTQRIHVSKSSLIFKGKMHVHVPILIRFWNDRVWLLLSGHTHVYTFCVNQILLVHNYGEVMFWVNCCRSDWVLFYIVWILILRIKEEGCSSRLQNWARFCEIWLTSRVYYVLQLNMQPSIWSISLGLKVSSL